ncbi:hypothetical protein HW555_009797 [Spodoptera exigua]|uniref:Uncharacterized protein n=1 Tax=Spodoptera exigua TaxID=7107 RepID=A0A835GBU7_SPOEX|nr:hypothetical protein HW555_009797 [Spodoptera exigua]
MSYTEKALEILGICNSLFSIRDGETADRSCEPRPYIWYRSSTKKTENFECGTVDPEYRLYQRTNSCYKLHTVSRTFNWAHFVCFAECSHLAIVNSYVESAGLMKLYLKYFDYKNLGSVVKSYAFIGIYYYTTSINAAGLSHQRSFNKALRYMLPQNSPGVELLGSPGENLLYPVSVSVRPENNDNMIFTVNGPPVRRLRPAVKTNECDISPERAQYLIDRVFCEGFFEHRSFDIAFDYGKMTSFSRTCEVCARECSSHCVELIASVRFFIQFVF